MENLKINKTLSKDTKVLLFNNTTSTENLAVIEEGLTLSAYELVENCSVLSEISRAVTNGSAEMVIAVTDVKFDELFACVKQLNQFRPVPVVVFTNVDDIGIIQSAVKAGVSAFIVDGLKAKRIVSILETARFRFMEHKTTRDELERTKTSLNERKLIEKAKGIVMQRSDIDEEEAYKAMRKMAMDKNIKMVELAKSVIAAAELII